MKITYLLGAGASYNSLPVLNELPSRLQNFIALLSQKKLVDPFPSDINLLCTELINDLSWLANETANHQTIDTFARKLFLNTKYHPKLKLLKALLTIYFLFEQTNIDRYLRELTLKENPDKRYDSFIASILLNKIDQYELNGSVKILTWNYDSQIELAYRNFNGTDIRYDDVQKHLQLIPSNWISENESKEIDLNKFSVLKLNGSATIYKDSNTHFFDEFKTISNHKTVYEFLIQKYSELKQDIIDSNIQYSWESITENNLKSPSSEILNDNLKRISEQTEILVVIGYSFPIFNRDVDKKIIESMLNLRKVYVQDVNPEKIISIMKSSFKRLQDPITKDDLGKVFFEQDSSLNSFLLPPELN